MVQIINFILALCVAGAAYLVTGDFKNSLFALGGSVIGGANFMAIGFIARGLCGDAQKGRFALMAVAKFILIAAIIWGAVVLFGNGVVWFVAGLGTIILSAVASIIFYGRI